MFRAKSDSCRTIYRYAGAAVPSHRRLLHPRAFFARKLVAAQTKRILSLPNPKTNCCCLSRYLCNKDAGMGTWDG